MPFATIEAETWLVDTPPNLIGVAASDLISTWFQNHTLALILDHG